MEYKNAHRAKRRIFQKRFPKKPKTIILRKCRDGHRKSKTILSNNSQLNAKRRAEIMRQADRKRVNLIRVSKSKIHFALQRNQKT